MSLSTSILAKYLWPLVTFLLLLHENVNGPTSDRALYKVRHIAAKLSHESNLAIITKLSLSLIHNIIGVGLPIFINATTKQQISIYSI